MSSEPSTWRKDVSRAYALLRLSLGLNICLHGVVRWVAGLAAFAHSLIPMFQKTPLPEWSLYGFGLALPILEALIGAAVAVGFKTRAALLAGAFLMLVLTFGSTLRQDWQTVAIQLAYSLIYYLLLAGLRYDDYCLDRLLDSAL